MALNAQEKEWLVRRKNLCARCSTSYRGRPYFCGRWRYGKCIDFDPKSCIDVNVDFEDAAEFEARVAIWLLDHDHEDVPCAHGMDIFCPRPRPPFVDKGCGKWCLLRCARLVIEQEMNNE